MQEKFVLALELANQKDALNLKKLLEEKGIPCSVISSTGTPPNYPSPQGLHRLYVLEEDIDSVQAFIDSLHLRP